jgi:putative transposase
MDKFQSKYRIPSSRMQNWDYSWNAPYFITICTADRVYYFGKIINGEMHLTEIGELANKYFAEIPEHFPNVHLNAFVVMPNHVHGIIIIDKPYYGINNDPIDNQSSGTMNNKWKSGTLGVIINQYKRICTINARKTNPGFGWHTRFHDHVIQDNESYIRIRNYIVDNPKNWNNDKFYK